MHREQANLHTRHREVISRRWATSEPNKYLLLYAAQRLEMRKRRAAVMILPFEVHP